ncbi:hypothetical protein SAMN03159382_04124 [Pseudomonas sp. NFACC23-1]|uniref:hypothetical protein n=1 Tax=unclassified Pseudomonas TaxID=196821 RepID=UPI00088C34EE|nr:MULTISPECIES: hypothetical protein [unclassified Pseudomonas]SDB53811.1 hypothetical protein SAMN03159386_04108 [Pseudomonas sp. NFACC17-2]SEJ74413.1 hypothetical protein SAMN03159382_04124 [Pseudomonas sp. NFACC23-1]SFW86246.1 hypothetical protein SAMN05660640_04493 [Pseudomonas sp. NFACC16-2]
MKLKIASAYHHGNVDKEHVVLSVLEDCNLGGYVLMDTTYDKVGNVSNKHRHVKWLPRIAAKKGDKVSVWTKTGTDESVTSDGVRWHRVYWNMHSSIWNNDGDVAVLLEINDVDHKRAK